MSKFYDASVMDLRYEADERVQLVHAGSWYRQVRTGDCLTTINEDSFREVDVTIVRSVK